MSKIITRAELEAALRYLLPILLPLGLCACPGPQPEVHEYGDLGVTLVCADKDSINYHCRAEDGSTTSDEGQPIPRANLVGPDKYGLMRVSFEPPIRACFDRINSTLWIPWGPTCAVLAHEFCHWNDYVGGRLTRADAAKCEHDYPPTYP